MTKIGKLAAAAVAAALTPGAAGAASAQEHVFKLHHLLSAKAPARALIAERNSR